MVEWRAVRVLAEEQARRAVVGEEIELSDIRGQLAACFGVDLAARAIELELRYELAATVGIAATLREIGDLIQDGRQVVYASDMYLPKQQVLAMLQKAGAPIVPLFLSSELGMTKRTGTLFRRLASDYAVPLEKIHHTGNDIHSDHRVPRRLGMKTTFFTDTEPTLLELDLYRQIADSAPVLATTWAGGMRAARLRLTKPKRNEEFLAHLGTQEGALVHIGFVLWLLRQFKALDPKKIAFLARDGYLPSILFKVLRPRIAPTLPAASYVFASRQALHLAGLKSIVTAEDREWIMLATPSLTFKDWLFRVGLQRAELANLNGVVESYPGDDEAFSICKDVCERLLRTPKFVAVVLEKAQIARDLAREYLTPGILPDEGSTAIVDIGWNGRMQRSLVEILSLPHESVRLIHGYYLGILRTPIGNWGDYTACLFDLRKEPRPYCASHFHLYETLFSAPHETTLGYVRDDAGQIAPILAPVTDPASRAGLIGFQNAILDIGEGIRTAGTELESAERAIQSICRSAVASMFRAPRHRHSMALGQMKFSSDQTDRAREKLVQELPWLQQYRLLFSRGYKISGNHWREGQLAQANAPTVRGIYAVMSMLRLWTRNQLSFRDLLWQIKHRLLRIRV